MPSRVPPPLVPIPPPARKSLLGGVSAPLGPPIRGGAAAGRAEGAFERGEGGHAHFTLRAQTLPPLPPSPQGRLGHLCARTRGMRGFTSPSLRPRAANTCIARNGAPLGQRSRDAWRSVRGKHRSLRAPRPRAVQLARLAPAEMLRTSWLLCNVCFFFSEILQIFFHLRVF